MSGAISSMPTGTFNPFTQSLNLTIPEQGVVPVSINDINAYAQYAIRICVNYGSQIGASVVLLLVLLLTTRAEKRWSAVFTLNVISLALNVIRNILQCIYFTGPYYNFYAYFGGDYSMVPRSQIATSCASAVLETILVITVEASLIFQVRVVCMTTQKLWRVISTVTSLLVAFVTIVFRMALMVENCRAIVNFETFYNFEWLAAASLYIFTSSVCFFSAIFVTKLAIALKQRRKLGLRQFGPMQVIFTMGCQTLLIPAIFSCLEYVTTVPELGSQALTVVVIFLPLSAMWAAQAISGPTSHSSNANTSLRRLFPQFTKSRSNKQSTRGKTMEMNGSSATTEEPDTPLFSTGKKIGDLESGDLKIFQTRTIDISQERKVDEF